MNDCLMHTDCPNDCKKVTGFLSLLDQRCAQCGYHKKGDICGYDHDYYLCKKGFYDYIQISNAWRPIVPGLNHAEIKVTKTISI